MQRRPTNPGTFGINPTASQKLQYVANKLGLQGISKMQGSTVNLFDTVLLPSSLTSRQTLSFFVNAGNKSRNFSNFQNGQLNAGEAMVIETVSFFLVNLSATNLSIDSTTINQMIPISQASANLVSLKASLTLGIMNLTIANSRVVKDYNTFEQNVSYNPKTSGIALGSVLDSADTATFPQEAIGNNTISLEAPPVLPPNQKIELTLELPPVGTVTGNIGVMCVIGRFGSIFASRTTL